MYFAFILNQEDAPRQKQGFTGEVISLCCPGNASVSGAVGQEEGDLRLSARTAVPANRPTNRWTDYS